MATIISRGPLYIRPGKPTNLGRGQQFDTNYNQTLPIRSLYCTFQNDSFQTDTFQLCVAAGTADGLAVGDAVASGVGDFLLAASPLKQLLDIRPGRATKLGRGAQLEFDQPLPLMILHNVDGDGAAQGDANASADSTFDTYPFSNWQDEQLRRGPGLSLRRVKGAQFEFQTPLPIQILSNRDGAGSAQGDAIASATGDGDAPMDGTATGDANASATGTSDTYPFANWLEFLLRRGPNRAVKLGRGAQIEYQQPITTGTQLSVAADGSAQGDANASATGESLADAPGTAQGDASASASSDSIFFPFDVWKDTRQIRVAKAVKLGRGTQIEFQTPLPIQILSNRDAAGSAQGDANASATGSSDAYPFTNWAEQLLRRGPNRAVKLGRGAQIEFSVPLPILFATATDGAGTAQGDANADAVSDVVYPPFAQNASGRLLRERGPNRAVKLGRGSQFEFQSPTPIRILSYRYGDGQADGGADAAAYVPAAVIHSRAKLIQSRESGSHVTSGSGSGTSMASQSSRRSKSSQSRSTSIPSQSANRSNTEVD